MPEQAYDHWMGVLIVSLVGGAVLFGLAKRGFIRRMCISEGGEQQAYEL